MAEKQALYQAACLALLCMLHSSALLSTEILHTANTPVVLIQCHVYTVQTCNKQNANSTK